MLAPSSSLAEITPVEIKLTNTKAKQDKDPSTGELQLENIIGPEQIYHICVKSLK